MSDQHPPADQPWSTELAGRYHVHVSPTLTVGVQHSRLISVYDCVEQVLLHTSRTTNENETTHEWTRLARHVIANASMHGERQPGEAKTVNMPRSTSRSTSRVGGL